uniref:Saposin A-type domain-containing protein n=1 Tax=Plectus sambesii TaxID=2011161 RepID=A0A914X6W7_9BILA
MLLLALISCFIAVAQCCDIPPDFWCDSPESAERCHVQAQCANYKKSFMKPIKVTFIYESLCPYCQNYIARNLADLYGRHRSLIELEMVPWGNAVVNQDGSFTCNHGEKECEANRLQSCVLEVVKMKHSVPFIICFENALHTVDVNQALTHCSSTINHALPAIRACFNGPRGIELQRQAADRTEATRPYRISEVPYILINDYSPQPPANTVNIIALKNLLYKWAKEVRR